MSRFDAAASARPAGRPSAFCVPVKAKSSCQRSNSRGSAPSEATASTSRSTSSCERTTRASDSSGASAPVDVSACTTDTASTPGPSRNRSRCAGSSARPGGTTTRTTSLPHASAIRAKRSPKCPPTTASSRWRTPARTAASMNPVADDVPTSTGRVVRNRCRSGRSIRAIMSAISAPRWLMTGRCMAATMSGCTPAGPGRRLRPNGTGLTA